MKKIQDFAEKIIHNIEKVIVGKHDVIELSVINLLCKGHLLIDDVPGVGKTMLARSLAISLGGSFSRIQFTPDMLPSDVTGVMVYDQSTQEFKFRPGPVMAEIVLADEFQKIFQHPKWIPLHVDVAISSDDLKPHSLNVAPLVDEAIEEVNK